MSNALRSVATPYGGDEASTCGYCSLAGERSAEETSYKVADLHAYTLTCEVYQKMIDRGWRRSGTYCYKPDLRRSCCPQYTIKLDALAFKVGKSHKKLVHRWNKYIIHGDGDMDVEKTKPKKLKGKNTKPFDLLEALHEAETGHLQEGEPAHKFDVTLEPSSYTDEKYELYCKYQQEIHKDKKNTQSGFKRFLVNSPLLGEPIPYTRPSYKLPPKYGSYHQMYRVDGKLIAIGVIDILPNCVSSVYFMYDSSWERFSLGKLSALREIALAREIHEAGVTDMKYLYMGFYIFSCQKMRYKAEYSPSYLADPETYEWYPFEQCKPLLEGNRYACFSEPDHCIAKEAPEDLISDPDPSLDDLDNIYLQLPNGRGGKIAIPVGATNAWEMESVKKSLCSCIKGLGLSTAESILWAL